MTSDLLRAWLVIAGLLFHLIAVGNYMAIGT